MDWELDCVSLALPDWDDVRDWLRVTLIVCDCDAETDWLTVIDCDCESVWDWLGVDDWVCVWDGVWLWVGDCDCVCEIEAVKDCDWLGVADSDADCDIVWDCVGVGEHSSLRPVSCIPGHVLNVMLYHETPLSEDS
jgi:hypothetical protein